MSDRKSGVIKDALEKSGDLEFHREIKETRSQYAYWTELGILADQRKTDPKDAGPIDLGKGADDLHNKVRQLTLGLPGDDADLADLVAWLEATLTKLLGRRFYIRDGDGVEHTLSGIVHTGNLGLWEKARREIRALAAAKRAEADLGNECARVSDVVGVRLRKLREKK